MKKTTIIPLTIVLICLVMASCKSTEEKQLDRDNKLATEFITKFYTNAELQELKLIVPCKVKDSLEYFLDKKKNHEEEIKISQQKPTYYYKRGKKIQIKRDENFDNFYLMSIEQEINKYEGQDTSRILYNMYIATFLHQVNNNITSQQIPIFITPSGAIGTADLRKGTMEIDWLK
jgi:hypothetical protein